jgi:AraC-like DNA-binding protein
MDHLTIVERHGPEQARVVAATRAIEQMRRQLAEPLHLADLARVASFSPFHFHRLFRDVTDMTPARFLAALRMAEARRRLLHSQATVTAISGQVGYTSAGTFTTQFTRLVGTSPAQFRRLARRVNREPVESVAAAALLARPLPNPHNHPRLLVNVVGGRLDELVLIGVHDVDGEGTSWCSANAGRPVTVLARPGRQEVRCLVIRPEVTLTQALVDELPHSYRAGSAEVNVPAAGTTVFLTPRAPRPTDPPALTIGPICRLAARYVNLRDGAPDPQRWRTDQPMLATA